MVKKNMNLQECINRLRGFTHLIEEEPNGMTFQTRLGIAEVFIEQSDAFAANVLKKCFVEYKLVEGNEDCIDYLDAVLLMSELEGKTEFP